MRQFGLDTAYASLTLDDQEMTSENPYIIQLPEAQPLTVFENIVSGYGHDKALAAYVGDAFDVLMEEVTERGSIDIEDDTLYCCACGACAGEQNSGPVMVDGYVTLASLLEASISYRTEDTYLGDLLQDVYDIDAGTAAQYFFDAATGEFIYVEGFDGVLTKGASISVLDGLGVVNAGGSSTTATAAATGDQRIDAVINGDYWTGGTISYAFSLSAAAYEYTGTGNEALPDNFNDVISAMQEDSAHFALSATQGVASAIGFSVEGFTNLTINFLGNVDSTTAEIRFAETSDPGTGTARVADFPGGQVTSSPNDDGDIWFGTANNFRIAEAGNYQWMTMIHEIGHALGLKHGHQNYNFGVLPSDTDSTEFSIMTYRSYIGQDPSGGATNEQWGFPQTFMMYDIATLQYFYGADFNVNSGNTVYSWSPSSGDTLVDGVVAIQPGGNRIYATIWDGDGIDTYDLSAYSTDLSIDLSPGGFSVFSAAQQASIGGGNFARGNIFNALQYQGDARSLIENAIGGTGDDTFVGNAADNFFDGGAGDNLVDYSLLTVDLNASLNGGGAAFSTESGNDTFLSIENLNSGSGNDTLEGSPIENIIKGGEGNDTIQGLEGNDELWGEIGDDMLFGGEGNDILRGGNDLANVGPTFGDGQITRDPGAGNDSIANALNIDDDYSLEADPDILNATTVPHVTISATGDGTVHYYAFTVYGPDSIVTLDIDYGDTGGAGSFNSFLELFDSAGVSVATNDFYPFPGGAGGSTSSEDALISFLAVNPGTYYVAVSESGGGGVPVDATYELNVSAENTAITDPDMGDDTLTGGMGDDMLFGGFGTDYAAFSGVQANYTVTENMDGTYLVVDNVGTDGSDTLDNIEFLIFTDVTIDIVSAASNAGGNVINGTAGDDNPLFGTAANDTINGLAGNDVIVGLDGNDLINGGEGDDWMDGGVGADVLNGDAGFDLLLYGGSDAAVTVNLGTGAASGGHAEGDSFSGVEGIVGSNNFGDTLTGDSTDNVLNGQGGDDILDGGAGDDAAVYLSVLQTDLTVTDNMDGTYTVVDNTGTWGTDTLSNIEFLLFDGNTFVDITTLVSSGSIDGTPGNDNLMGTSADDVINGLEGNDILDGLAGNDTINGGDGADRLIGGEGADSLNGDAGFDSADYRGALAGVAFNVDTGGTGGEANGDTFSGIERYYLSNFNDTVTGSSANEFFFGEDGNDTINAGGGIDRLYGGDGNDIQRGQDGNDQLYGSAGSDQLNGGAGFDIANYSLATSGVIVNMLTGGTGGDAAGDTYFGIEAVYGSDFDDGIFGNNSANELRGGDGNDNLEGGGGNDRLFGGAGEDMLFGGTGTDIAVYTEASSGVGVNLEGAGTFGEALNDIYSEIEWVFGSDFDDDITGDSANNRLEGRDGNDILNGGEGNDRLLGGDGNDTINGGDGVDTIFGQDGDDIMTGGAGNDFFFGGAGADSHDGGSGTDTVSYLASSSGLTINMSGLGTASTGDAAGDSFVSIERIFGSGFDDNLIGDFNDNVLIGNGGADYLAGGGGNDSLNGGAGIDSFGYDEVVDAADVIQGFTLNEVVFIFGGTVTDFASLQALGSDAGANVIFDFGGGNTLTIVGHNLADLDASNFDFSGTPPAAQPLSEPDAFAAEPFEDMTAMFDMDALI